MTFTGAGESQETIEDHISLRSASKELERGVHDHGAGVVIKGFALGGCHVVDLESVAKEEGVAIEKSDIGLNSRVPT